MNSPGMGPGFTSGGTEVWREELSICQKKYLLSSTMRCPGRVFAEKSLHPHSTSGVHYKSSVLTADAAVRSQHLNGRFGLKCPEK